MKNLTKPFILIGAMLFCFQSNSQVTLVDTMSNLQTCFKPEIMRLGFVGTTGSSGQYVDVLLPTGHTFEGLVGGSVTGGGSVAYSGVFNGFHRFTISGGSGNPNINIRFLQMARCGAGTGSYTARDSIIFNNGTNSYPKSGSLFNGASPDLSITTGASLHTPNTATVGTVVTRKFTVTNGGFGSSSNFIIVDKSASLANYTVDLSSFWIDSTLGTRFNIPLSNVTQSGDSVIVKFDATTIQNIGDLDTAFANGESFELRYKFTVNTCGIPTISTDLLTSWMCPDLTRCDWYKITTGISTFGPAFPRLQLAQRLPRRNDCFDGTTVWGDTLVLRNNSTGAATDILIDAGGYRTNFGQNYPGAYFDTASFKVKIGKNGPEFKPAFTIESVYTSDYAGCNFKDSANHIRFTIPELEGGDSLYIMMGQVQCAYTKSCIVNQSFSSTRHINGQYARAVYKNACGNATYNMSPVYVIPYRSHYADGTNSGPLSIGDGQSTDLSLDIGNFSNKANTELYFGNRAYREVTITKPNVLIYDPAFTDPVYFEHPTHGVLLPYYRSANGDTFKFRISASFTGTGTVFHAKVKGQCDGATCSGILDYTLHFSHNPDTTYCTRENPEICLKYPFAWTSSCIVCCPKGMVNLRYDLNRINYGLADDDNDGLPSGTLDLSKINTKRVIPGDTAEFVHKFYLKTDATDTQWDYLRSIMTVAATLHYSVVSDSVWVDRLSGTDSVFAMTPTTSGTNKFVTDLSAMPAFQQGDTVTIKLKLRVLRNPTSNVVSFNSEVGGGASNDNFTTSYACGSFIDKQEIYGTDAFGYESFSGNVNGCQQYLIYHRFYVRIGGGSDRYQNFKFPYEYRPIATPLRMKVAIPADYTVDSVELGSLDYYAGQALGVSTYPAGTNIPFTFVNDTLEFDVRNLFAKYGGNIVTGDEGCYIRFDTRVTPSCKTNSGVPERFQLLDSFDFDVPLSNSSYNMATSSGQTGSTLANFHPNLIYSSASPVANAYSKEVSWPLSVNNLTVFNATRNWLYFTNNSGDVSIDSLKEGSTVITPDVNGFYKIETINGGATRNFTVYGTSIACDYDSILVHSGWSCQEYPTAFTDTTCGRQPIPLYVQPQPASIQTQITSLSSSPVNPFNGASAGFGSNEVTMCQNFPFEMEIQSTQPGTIYDVIEESLLPFNGAVGLDLIVDSITVEYPIGTAPRLAAYQGRALMASTISSGNMTMNLQRLDTANFGLNQGLPGTGLGNNNTRRVILRWKMRTNCDIVSGDQWNARQKANAACGSPATGNNQITSGFPIDIAGVIKPYQIASEITPRIGGCSEGNCDTTDILITKIGPSVTANDSIFIKVSEEAKLGAIQCYGVNCPGGSSGLIPASSVNEVIQSGFRILTFPVPAEFDANADTIRFAVKGWSAEPSGCQSNLQMESGIRIPATLTCNSIPCPASNANLGVGSGTFDIQLPELGITAMNGVFMNFGPDHTYRFTATAENSTSGAAVRAGDTTVLNIYRDENANLAFDPGVDSLMKTFMYNYSFASGESKDLWGEFQNGSTPDPNKAIFSVIEADSVPNCNCTKTVVSPMLVGLPVDFLKFNAVLLDGDGYLTWNTASEINSDKFEIERMVNGVGGYTKVGEVKAAGFSNVEKYYNFTDELGDLNADFIIYRIKQIDLNGEFKYSNFVYLNLAKAITKYQVSVYPNPASSDLKITISNTKGSFDFSFTNAMGQSVMEGTSNNDASIDVSNLPKGVYVITVSNDGEINEKTSVVID